MPTTAEIKNADDKLRKLIKWLREQDMKPYIRFQGMPIHYRNYINAISAALGVYKTLSENWKHEYIKLHELRKLVIQLKGKST